MNWMMVLARAFLHTMQCLHTDLTICPHPRDNRTGRAGLPWLSDQGGGVCGESPARKICTSAGRVLDLLSLPPTLITPEESR